MIRSTWADAKQCGAGGAGAAAAVAVAVFVAALLSVDPALATTGSRVVMGRDG